MILLKKIAIISWKSINQNVIERNYIKSLKKEYKIYLLDISFLLNFDTNSLIKKKIKNSKNLRIIKIKKFNDLVYDLNKIKPNIIIPYFLENYSHQTKLIFSYLQGLNIPLMKIICNSFLFKIEYFRDRVKSFIFKKPINYQYIIHSSTQNFSHYYKSKNNIFSHHFDYETFLNIKNKKKTQKKSRRYALFLDENIVFHPDLILNKRKNWIKPKEYFNSMKKFFTFISNTFDLDVKIATHPTNFHNDFGVHKSYINNTAKLVSNAELVFLHQSTSLSFPILSKKKILFLTSDQINKTNLKKSIYRLTKFFNKKPINVNKPYEKESIKKNIIAYSNKYQEYKNLILKHEKSPNQNFIYIFKKFFAKKNLKL